jgi:hypothetical protein
LWSSVNQEQRQALGRHQTAKALHGYYSTHTNPTAHKIETLGGIAGLKQTRMMPSIIIKAHEALCAENVGFLTSYEVKDNKIKAIIKRDK